MSKYKKYMSIIQEMKVNTDINLKDAKKDVKEVTSGEKKILMFLIGPPSAGKSTIINDIKSNYEKKFGKIGVIERDAVVNSVAGRLGITYDDMFLGPSEKNQDGGVLGKWVEADSRFPWWQANGAWENVQKANLGVQSKMEKIILASKSSQRKILIIDMTNMNVAIRKGMLAKFEDENFIKIAVNLFNNIDESKKQFLIKNAEKRSKALADAGKPKTINKAIMERMFNSYEEPTKAEGFNYVIKSDNITKIMEKIKF